VLRFVFGAVPTGLVSVEEAVLVRVPMEFDEGVEGIALIFQMIRNREKRIKVILTILERRRKSNILSFFWMMFPELSYTSINGIVNCH
jgi:hypothetical protein